MRDLVEFIERLECGRSRERQRSGTENRVVKRIVWMWREGTLQGEISRVMSLPKKEMVQTSKGRYWLVANKIAFESWEGKQK